MSTVDIADFIIRQREQLGLTQLEVSEKIEISRAAYSQMELGKRKVGVLELIKLSSILEFSLSEVFAQVYSVPDERAKPIFNFERFKTVLLYILQKCKNKTNVGRTVLYKLLYFSDFNYYEKYNDFLMGVRYSRLPKGPVPNVTPVIEQLINNGDIDLVDAEFYGYPQKRYVALTKPDLLKLTKNEIEVIDDVLKQLSKMTANEVSEYSHGDSPWLKTGDFEEINYNLVFKRNKKYKYVK